MVEKKRFFKDELESSMETTKSFNTSFDNSKSFLFNPTQENIDSINDKDIDNNKNNNYSNNNNTSINIDTDSDEDDDIEIIQESQQSPKDIFTKGILDVVPDVDPKIISELFNTYKNTQDPLTNALSYYFENYQPSDGNSQKITYIPSSPIKLSPPKRKLSTLANFINESPNGSNPKVSSKKLKKPVMKWKRFIGALQVTAMATRPTMKPLTYGSKLKLVKQQLDIPTSKLYDSKGRQKKMMSSYVKIFDIQFNREIGKVPEDIARIIYPLLATDEVIFDTTLVFCDDKRLSIGDHFVLELDCYLTSILFQDESELLSSQSSQNLNHRINNNNNNNNNIPLHQSFKSNTPDKVEDMESKSRRVALLTLFKKLRLRPLQQKEEDLIKSQHIESAEQEDEDIIDLEDDENFDDIMSQSYENPEIDAPNYSTEESMNLNQLQTFYNSAQSNEALKNLPETNPPFELVKMTLRPYQKQGLTWMLRREHEYDKTDECENLEVDGDMMNPLWKQFKWPKNRSWNVNKLKEKSTDDTQTNNELFFYANLHTGDFSMEKPILKTMIKGGILSDEMGLGKTISALSLVLMAPFDSRVDEKKVFKTDTDSALNADSYRLTSKKPYASKTTLIIVPMSLLNQWHSEFNSINNCSKFRSEIYYGGNVSSLKTLLIKTKNPPTVILTTYGIVQNEWSKLFREGSNSDDAVMSSNGLFSLDFYRIIIDEGHTIRNRSTITSKSVMDLSSKCKWILTGTPIINRLDDLFSMVKFLKLEPWCNVSYWKTFVSNPFESKDFKQAFDVVNSIMQPVLLRRTKQMKNSDGEPLVELPPKEIIIKRLKLNKTQKAVYKYFLDIAENSVKIGLARGDLLKKYSTILVHILRLRQICCDVELLGTLDDNDEDIPRNSQMFASNTEIKRLIENTQNTTDEEFDEKEMTAIISSLKQKYPNLDSLKKQECSICTTEDINIDKMLLTECGHTFCENCLSEYIDYQKNKDKDAEIKCPLCRSSITRNKLFAPSFLESKDTVVITHYKDVAKSAKLAALVENLRQLQDSSSGEQVIVFSQFSSFLDILERDLGEAFGKDKAEIYKFDGRLSLKERSTVLKEFQEKDFSKQKILLLSLKAGGVGLNLTCASYAYMMDPWWSPSMEDQAIDRIHRIGQTNNVKVFRFIIEGSIEEKMLRIQERKRTIGEAMDADQEERRKRRIEEIKTLFE
ncbi:DNA repair protein Rad5p [Monosporozyma servazzii]